MAVETSASSRAIRCGCISTTVTVGPEAPEHLRELEPHVDAADDHQVLGHAVQREDRAVVEVRRPRSTPGMGGTAARPPTLMKMRGADSTSSPTRTCGRALRSGRARAAPCSPACRAASRSMPPRERCHDGVGARLDARHVHGDGALDHDAVVARAARQVRGVGAGDQRLGGHASRVDAGPAEQAPLDERHLHAGAREPPRERRPGLPGPDDDGVERGHGPLPRCPRRTGRARLIRCSA